MVTQAASCLGADRRFAADRQSQSAPRCVRAWCSIVDEVAAVGTENLHDWVTLPAPVHTDIDDVMTAADLRLVAAKVMAFHRPALQAPQDVDATEDSTSNAGVGVGPYGTLNNVLISRETISRGGPLLKKVPNGPEFSALPANCARPSP